MHNTVIGAIQGLKVAAPQITDAMRTGISEVILILIFAIQPIGTTKIAVTFAPIVVIWLLLNLACGVYNLVYYDASVFQALSPYWIYHWFAHHGRQGWEMMGGTLLAITGVEALFADLGHFHASSVRLSWLGFAYPVSSRLKFPRIYSLSNMLDTVPFDCLPWPSCIHGSRHNWYRMEQRLLRIRPSCSFLVRFRDGSTGCYCCVSSYDFRMLLNSQPGNKSFQHPSAQNCPHLA